MSTVVGKASNNIVRTRYSPDVPMMEPAIITALKDARLRALYRHWDEMRGTKRLPARKSLDPVKMAMALPIIFLCDYESKTGRLRYRVAGDAIAERYSIPLAGRYQDEFFSSQERAAHLVRVQRIMKTPAIIHVVGAVYARTTDRQFGDVQRTLLGVGERIGLPLASDGETPDALIGATAYDWAMPDRVIQQEHRPLGWTLWSLDGSSVLDTYQERCDIL